MGGGGRKAVRLLLLDRTSSSHHHRQRSIASSSSASAMADLNKEKKKDKVEMVEIKTQFKRRKADYGWIREQVSPNHFCKVVVAPNLEVLPVPEAFRPYLGEVPAKIRLDTNTGCVWTIHLNKFKGRACLDKAWAPFATSHNIGMGMNLLFKKLGPRTFRVIIFDNTGIEIVKECPPHPTNVKMDN